MKYRDLTKRLEKDYTVKYCDLSLGAIGVIGTESKGIQKNFRRARIVERGKQLPDTKNQQRMSQSHVLYLLQP